MMGSAWTLINEKIRNCRRHKKIEDVINCLRELFLVTNDGMAANAIGQEYEKIGNFKEAIKYFEKTKLLFPLRLYKKQATESINRVKEKLYLESDMISTAEETIEAWNEILNLSNMDPSSTLFIFSCSKERIWDNNLNAPDYIDARYAYRGKRFTNFLIWVDDSKMESKGFFWIILSGKYGFIEPWHSISRYDVNLGDPKTYTISSDTLKNQVNQIRWWREAGGKIRKIRLADFHSIIGVNCNKDYLEKIILCFPEAELQQLACF